jgi:hypothetical protein
MDTAGKDSIYTNTNLQEGFGRLEENTFVDRERLFLFAN